MENWDTTTTLVVVGAIVIAVSVIGLYLFYRIRQAVEDERQHQLALEELLRIERRFDGGQGQEPPREPQRRVSREGKRPIWLQDLTLIINESQDRKVGRLVNPTTARSIRPVAVIEVNDDKLIGRMLPVEFNLVGPRGGINFVCRVFPILHKGVNYVTTQQNLYPVSNSRTPKGSWHIRLWVGKHEWGEQEFAISTSSTTLIASSLGGDLELNPVAERRAAELASGASIDDLLS